MIHYRFALSVRHALTLGPGLNRYAALWQHAGSIARQTGAANADCYRLTCDLIKHAPGFTYWGRPGITSIPFRGWLIPRAFFEAF